MPERRPTVLFIGSMPPPYHGPAVNTKALFESPLLNERFQLVLLDIADRRDITNIGKWDWTNIRLALQHGASFVWKLVTCRPEVVYVPISQGTPGFLRDCLFMLPAIWTERKLILHLRGSYFRKFYESSPAPVQRLIRYVLARAARVIVLGKRLRPIFEELVLPEQIVVIPNGLDPKPFDRTRPTGRTNGFYVTYLANLVEDKGYWQLLESVPLVLQKRRDVRFTLAGAFYRPESAHRCEQFIRDHELQEFVSLPGVVTGEDKVDLLLGSDVFVFPTRYPYEGHPMVILEAMAAGLPIITTDQAAIPETVLDNMTGFVLSQPDPATIAEKTLLLLQDESLRRRLGQAGRERFLSHYTLARCTQDIARVFQDVVEKQE
jgi:glycosyltransferase involved in cell wall biosynthesis